MVQIILLLLTSLSITPIIICDYLKPLYLTPLIKQNRTEEARNLSAVDAETFHLKSYSGYLTVNETYNSNTFFWYFPVLGRDLGKTPWIIWLQGGPGASSLVGLFKEVGPFSYDNGIKVRETSWCKNYSMVFIDNPVGTGFSFTESDQGYPEDIETYSAHLYNAVKQLTLLYPELGSAPLYVAGESYAGRYVPGLAMKIIQEKRDTNDNINLQGLIMGNPTLDRDSIVDFTRVFYSWGLVDAQGARAALPLQREFEEAVRNGDAEKANDLRGDLLDKLQSITFKGQLYNVLKTYTNLWSFLDYVNSLEFKRLVHVGQRKFVDTNYDLHNHMKKDTLASVSPKIEKILEHCKILIYCGQLDLTSPCVLNAEARRKKWHWSGRDKFLSAVRMPLLSNDSQWIGYIKSGGGFTEVLLIDAGHLVPIDKPAELRDIVINFIENVEIGFPLPMDKDLPQYEEYRFPNITGDGYPTETTSKGYVMGLIASSILNIVFLVAILLCVILLVRYKKRYYMSMPVSEDILTLE